MAGEENCGLWIVDSRESFECAIVVSGGARGNDTAAHRVFRWVFGFCRDLGALVVRALLRLVPKGGTQSRR